MSNFIKIYKLLFFILLIFGIFLTHKAFSQEKISDKWQKDIPKEAIFFKGRGKELIQQKQYDAAISELEKSLKLKKDYYLAAYNLALAYALKGSDLQSPSESDRQRAWHEFKKTQQISEAHGIRDSALYSTMGWLALMDALFSPPQAFARRREKYKAAEQHLEESLKIEAATSGTFNNLGVLYELRGDLNRSLSYYKQSAALGDTRGEENYERLQVLVQKNPDSVHVRLPSPLPKVGEPTPDGQLTLALHFESSPSDFDPAETRGTRSFLFLYALHDALVKPMPGNLYTPSLAESWDMSEDGRMYEFKLRKGVTFHNGEPLTAEDVKFSLERYRGVYDKLYQEKIAQVEIADEYRVRIYLKEPWPDFLAYYGTLSTGAGWVVPKRYIEKVGDDGFKKHPIGVGPYRFVSYTPGQRLILEAYKGYWRKVPHVKRLVWMNVPDPATRLAALNVGEVDIAYALPVLTEIPEIVKQNPQLRLVSSAGPGVVFLDFAEQWNPSSPWHNDLVRLAANYAIDREALSEKTSGAWRPTASIVPSAFEFARPLEPYPYDPEKAKALLREAGYPNNFAAGDLFFSARLPYDHIAERVASDLQRIGIHVKMRQIEPAAFFSAWRGKKLPGLILGSSSTFGNAATRLESFVASGGEYTQGSDDKINILFKAQTTARDQNQRKDILYSIQGYIYEKALFAPLLEIRLLHGVGPRVAEPGIGLIPLYYYTGPYEDMQLNR